MSSSFISVFQSVFSPLGPFELIFVPILFACFVFGISVRVCSFYELYKFQEVHVNKKYREIIRFRHSPEMLRHKYTPSNIHSAFGLNVYQIYFSLNQCETLFFLEFKVKPSKSCVKLLYVHTRENLK